MRLGQRSRKLAELLAFRSHFVLAKFAGFAESDDAGNVERAGTHAALVAAAVNLSGKLHARILAANVQRADALGAVNLVAGDRHQVDAVFLDVHGNFADGLHCVHMKEDALFFGDLADFRDGLNHADFVVGVHDGDQDGLGRDGAAQIVEIDAAVFLHRQIGDFVAVFFEALTGIEHGLVLGHLRDDVVALFAIHFRGAFDGQVGRFRGAAGENDFFRRGVDQLGDLAARVFHGFFGYPAEFVVAAGGVAELLSEIGQHRFDNARVHRRGRVIVHINRKLNCHSILLNS